MTDPENELEEMEDEIPESLQNPPYQSTTRATQVKNKIIAVKQKLLG